MFIYLVIYLLIYVFASWFASCLCLRCVCPLQVPVSVRLISLMYLIS